MAFLATLGMLALYASLLALFLRIAWAIYRDQRRLHIPPEIKYPIIVRILYTGLKFGGFIESFFKKSGLCNPFKLLVWLYRTFIPKWSPTLTIKDLVFDGIPVRVYWPKRTPSGKRRGVVVIPGGGGVVGNIGLTDIPCRYIARETDSVVMTVAFRLAPEHPFPIPVMDCCTATKHFLKNAEEYGVDPHRIVLYGECSGGTFAVAVSEYLAGRKDLPKLGGQVLIYPGLQAVDLNLPSYQQNHSIPFLFKKWALMVATRLLTAKEVNLEDVMKNAHLPEHVWMKYRKWVNPDDIPERFKGRGYVPMERPPFRPELYEIMKEATNPMYSPLLAEDDVIRQLPKTFLLTCEYDIFRDDGLLFKKRLEDNGVPLTWYHIEDGFHGILFGVGNSLMQYPGTKLHCQHIHNFINSI
ncbi:arylacetamide deacetylase-like 4 [Anolis sagrei]|uniref:arylacetamide deacetylase-like 4 n=1 Tax=Anolis sagrei TaxID=38937 RepID=UPI00351FEBE2